MIKVQIDGRALRRAEKILAKVDDNVAIAAYDKGLKAAGNVVAKRARSTAPRGDRSRQSAKSKHADAFNRRLYQAIAVKVVGAGVRNGTWKRPMALVGVRRPGGNQLNFVHPYAADNGGGKATKKQVYWGKGGREVSKRNDFLKQAFDNTRTEQVRAFTRALIPEIRRNLSRAKRG